MARNRGDVVDVPDAEADVESVPTAEETAAKDNTVDLTAFHDAVASGDTAAVEAAYNALSRGGKLQAKNSLKSKLQEAVEADDWASAKKFSGSIKHVGSLTGSASTSTAADPTEELVNRIAALRIANSQLSANHTDLEERVATLVGSPNETVTALATRLVETKMGRKPREGGGTRHNVANHIAQVFADKEPGTVLTVKEIAEAHSEEYGDDAATVTSVQAHIKSDKFNVEGVERIEQDKKLALRKL